MRSKLILCLALVLSGGLFGCSKPLRQTHQEITLSNSGTINIDCTWHPENDFVEQNVTYKLPGGGKPEYFYGGAFSGPLEAYELSSYVVGPLVVVIIGEPIMVRARDGVWKTFSMGMDFPSTNDFSAEDIQLMGITSQRSFAPDLQRSVSTEVENFDPQTRIFFVNYNNYKNTKKHLALQISEDGTKLKVLNVREIKN
jgi:hypothetical protein